MNNFATDVKDTLIKLIHDISNVSFLFCKNSNTDFTRNRKLNFETMIHMMLTMEGGSLSKEMLEYFNFSTDTATVSAFNQQRKKIMPAAFEFLFHEFNALYLGTKKYEGYNLIACDGSDINISRNPSDIDTYFHSKSFGKGFNQLHLNAFYNILERRYTDALIQPARKDCFFVMQNKHLKTTLALRYFLGTDSF